MVTQCLYSYMVDTDWAVFYLRGREPFVSLLKELRSAFGPHTGPAGHVTR